MMYDATERSSKIRTEKCLYYSFEGLGAEAMVSHVRLQEQ